MFGYIAFGFTFEIIKPQGNKKMNELVMYNNDLNAIILPESFTDAELRVFFAIVSRLRDKGSSEVTFAYSYLKDITKEKRHYTKEQYSELIRGIYHKIIGLRFAYKTDEVVGEVNLFQGYEKSLTDDSFSISVSPKFQYIFNELSINGSFTAWNLSDFCDLPGVYTKQLYRLLKQWKYVGSASFVLNDLRKYMGAPEKYATKDITRRVINPAVEKLRENSPEFQNLSYEYSNVKNKAYRVKFKWTPEKRVKGHSKEPNYIQRSENNISKIEHNEESAIDPNDFKNEKGKIDWDKYIEAIKEESKYKPMEDDELKKKEEYKKKTSMVEWETFLKYLQQPEQEEKMPQNIEETSFEMQEHEEDAANATWTLDDFLGKNKDN